MKKRLAAGALTLAFCGSLMGAELTKGRDWAQTSRLSFPSRWIQLEQWHLAGAFSAGKDLNFKTEFGPEKGPLDLHASYLGPEGSVIHWQKAPDSWADAGQPHDLLLFPLKEHAAAYVTAEFTSDKVEELELVGGSDDTFTLWVNGKQLVNHEVYRASGPEQEQARFQCVKGKNILLLKVCQGILGWNFYLDLRRPFKQSKAERLGELQALRSAHPEDQARAWEADLEIADAKRASGDTAGADAILAPYTQDIPPPAWPQAPAPLLKAGDDLILVGDSITEQRMYSRLMELYLRACQRGLLKDFRQSGWSGQRTADLLARLDQDVLAFQPSVVLDAYGANDTLWDKYSPAAAAAYAKHTRQLGARLKKAGARLIVSGTTAAVGPPEWRQDKAMGVVQTNQILADLNAKARATAAEAGLPFIPVFSEMLYAQAQGLKLYGRGFKACGDDGVHPEWAGHMVAATARLLGLGLDGELARISLDLGSGKASATGQGLELLASGKGWVKLRSTRYPFCLGPGKVSDHHTWVAGARLAPFQQRLNRYVLQASHAGKGKWRLRWGKASKVLKGAELEQGVNLAELFEAANPFSANFFKADAAIEAKQAFEMKELHEVLHGPLKGQAWKDAVAAAEAERSGLVKAVDEALAPVEHELRLKRLP